MVHSPCEAEYIPPWNFWDPMSGRKNSNLAICQLENDVLNLQLLLQKEIKLHIVLEKAVEDAAVKLSDLSCLPKDARELLISIATLESTVEKLEEEMVSLNFQLIQERNERRLAEYQLKQLSGSPEIMCPIAQGIMDDMVIEEEEEEHPSEQIQQFGKLGRTPYKGLMNHPNALSEELVR